MATDEDRLAAPRRTEVAHGQERVRLGEPSLARDIWLLAWHLLVRATGPLRDAPAIDAARNARPPLCKVEQEVMTVDELRIDDDYNSTLVDKTASTNG